VLSPGNQYQARYSQSRVKEQV